MSDIPAIDGGEKVRTGPWPERGIYGKEEKEALNVLLDEAIASGKAPGYGGPEEDAYCKEFAEMMGGGYANGVNSGTNAVYVALRSLDLPPFSEVAVGCITDAGGIMPIPLLNCIPVPVDTAPGSFSPGPEQVEAAMTPRTSAILIAHIFGEPSDIEGIIEVADKHGVPVVEDCAQAHYTKLNGKMLGTFGKVSAFSTMFGKLHCTGGQGGLVFTKDEEVYKMIKRSSDRGKPFGLPAGTSNQFASLNMNMDEISACIGRIQLKKLPGFVKHRQKIYAAVKEGISDLKAVFIPDPIPGAESSYWRIRVGFRPEKANCDKKTFYNALVAEGLTNLEPSCIASQHLADWFVNKKAFGNSQFPWNSSDYKGDHNKTYSCPNAIKSTETYFKLFINEAWTDEDICDAVKIFRKVDKCLSLA